MRRSGELAFVNVFVTVLALRLRDFEKGIFALQAFRHVAFVASDRNVLAFERIFRGRMIFDRKDGRLEAIYGMARSAFATVGASPELAFVCILVAVHAFCERHGRFEISMRVAVATGNGGVFAEQGIFCLGVIEALQLSDPVPIRRVMARLTRRGKAALVGIRVAPRTLKERQSRVLYIWFGVGDGWMALGAQSLFVRSGERILGLSVAKKRSGLPGFCRVATCAIFPDLAAVLVLMAGGTLAGESKIGPS
jgi:hypothetical protein